MHRLLVLVALALAAGCRPPGPVEALEGYRRAVASGRIDRAWDRMSAEYRRTHDRAAFERELASAAARRAEAAPLAGARVTWLAQAQLSDGTTLPLVFEDGAWRLGADPLDFYPQATPEEALRSFTRAVERGRYQAALKFVPARYRATLTADGLRARWEGEKRQELLAELARVRAHLDDPLEVAGDEARLPLGDRKEARLHREDDGWKVESLE